MICAPCKEGGKVMRDGLPDEARLLHNHCHGKKKSKTHCDCQCVVLERSPVRVKSNG
jgi:hypothetical protein